LEDCRIVELADQIEDVKHGVVSCVVYSPYTTLDGVLIHETHLCTIHWKQHSISKDLSYAF